MATKHDPEKTNTSIGLFGERVIAQFLRSNGAKILDRNWRIKDGEIDIVARHDSGTIAFVEVKTRSSLAFGHPLESISSEKSQRLQRLALGWLAAHHCLGVDYQIDCAAVLLGKTGEHSIEYRANVL